MQTENQAAGRAVLTDPTMTYLGLLTGKLNIKDLRVTTTEQAPRGAILIHPSTLTDIAVASDGLLDLVKPSFAADTFVPAPETPITVEATSNLCLKILNNPDTLSLDESQYIVRVLELPENDMNRRILDITTGFKNIVHELQPAQSRPETLDQRVQEESTETNETAETGEGSDVELNQMNPVCNDCLNNLEDVFETIQDFVDEYGVSGPGYIDIDYDKDVTEEVLSESINRFKENEGVNPSPSFSEAMSRSLAIEVARSMIYEKFIVDLAEKVGFAQDDEETLFDDEA